VEPVRHGELVAGIHKYAAFFGRAADLVREPEPAAEPAIAVARFPPMRVGFLRRLFTQLPERCVYVTHGMSSAAMHAPATTPGWPSHIELLASCAGAYVGDDGVDVASQCLQDLAALPFATESFLGPMHTATLGREFGGSRMSAFLFTVPTGLDLRRLCACTPAAQLVVGVMPITAAERDFAAEYGSEQLIERFEARGVANAFDLSRAPVV
jgi:hypothetical protein